MTKIEPLRVRYGDDPEMDRWMSLTDEQQQRELDIAIHQHNEAWNALTLDQQYASLRSRGVAGCLRMREMITETGWGFLRDQLKERQINLVKLREWRRTGIYPGEA